MPEHQRSYYGATATEAGITVCYPPEIDGDDMQVMLLAQIVYACPSLRSATRSAWAMRVGCRQTSIPQLIARCPGVRQADIGWYAYSQIELEPTGVAVFRVLSGVAALAWTRWIEHNDAHSRAKHNDSTMVMTAVPSNVDVAALMEARRAGNFEVSLTQCQAARTTTIYASRMTRAERHSLVDAASGEPIVEVDISTCAPACWLAYRSTQMHTAWLQKLQDLVAGGGWYEEIMHGTFGVAVAPGMRSWIKTVVATYLSRSWRQGSALLRADAEGKASELWPYATGHEEAYARVVRYIQARWPGLDRDLQAEYAKARNIAWRKPYARGQALEASVINMTVKLYRKHCALAGITPVISTVYDCLLTRRSHAYIVAEALSAAMVHFNVRTSMTIDGVKRSWNEILTQGTPRDSAKELKNSHTAVQQCTSGHIIVRCKQIIVRLQENKRSARQDERGDCTINKSSIGRGGTVINGTVPSPLWLSAKQLYRLRISACKVEVYSRTEQGCWEKALAKLELLEAALQRSGVANLQPEI